MRISHYHITELKPNEVFVYGDNEAHIHGAGAAKQAIKWGAKYYKSGLQGQTLGIPTKNKRLNVLGLGKISKHIDEFIEFTKTRPDLIFLVTEIGCGLAGYKPEQIAPLFKNAINLENVYLPKSFWNILL